MARAVRFLALLVAPPVIYAAVGGLWLLWSGGAELVGTMAVIAILQTFTAMALCVPGGLLGIVVAAARRGSPGKGWLTGATLASFFGGLALLRSGAPKFWTLSAPTLYVLTTWPAWLMWRARAHGRINGVESMSERASAGTSERRSPSE